MIPRGRRPADVFDLDRVHVLGLRRQKRFGLGVDILLQLLLWQAQRQRPEAVVRQVCDVKVRHRQEVVGGQPLLALMVLEQRHRVGKVLLCHLQVAHLEVSKAHARQRFDALAQVQIRALQRRRKSLTGRGPATGLGITSAQTKVGVFALFPTAKLI